MERARWLICLLALLAAPAGCTSSNSGSPDTSTDAAARDEHDAPDAVEAAKEAVAEFLEAVRTGDDGKASEMLTPLAREKTAERDMQVAPPGSETASFEVTEAEILSPEETEADVEAAHVASTWTDVGDDGENRTDEILWVVKHEPEGWRIAGMITKVFDDQDPMILNFEDPDDMARKQEAYEEEIERRARKDAERFLDDAQEQSVESDGMDDEGELADEDTGDDVETRLRAARREVEPEVESTTLPSEPKSRGRPKRRQ